MKGLDLKEPVHKAALCGDTGSKHTPFMLQMINETGKSQVGGSWVGCSGCWVQSCIPWPVSSPSHAQGASYYRSRAGSKNSPSVGLV